LLEESATIHSLSRKYEELDTERATTTLSHTNEGPEKWPYATPMPLWVASGLARPQ
jgi:hypothetical protein